MKHALKTIACSLMFTSQAYAIDIKIASWNIANLHHQERVEVRPGIGTKRSSGDYDLLKKYSVELGREKEPADIIALQEIGTLEGAERIYPPEKYNIVMSKRYERDVASGNSEDIYTAIVIRKDQSISIIKQEDLEGLIIMHEGDDGVARPTRSGTALLLDVDGTQLWVLSVHLKSSCSSTRSIDTSTNDHCETLWKQSQPLANWIEARREESIPFIIAGDFNRRFRQLNDDGPLYRAINLGDLDNPVVSKHPETVTRKCATRKGRSQEPIDWFLIDAEVADWFVEGSFWETRFSRDDVDASGGSRSQRLSDHCPISLNLKS